MRHIRWKKYLYLSHKYSGIITSFFIFLWRLILNDESQSRFYFSATTAEQQLYLDHNDRSYRWLFYALHQWDLSILRQRPLWDILLSSVLLLLTLFAISALIMAKQRLQR